MRPKYLPCRRDSHLRGHKPARDFAAGWQTHLCFPIHAERTSLNGSRLSLQFPEILLRADMPKEQRPPNQQSQQSMGANETSRFFFSPVGRSADGQLSLAPRPKLAERKQVLWGAASKLQPVSAAPPDFRLCAVRSACP